MSVCVSSSSAKNSITLKEGKRGILQSFMSKANAIQDISDTKMTFVDLLETLLLLSTKRKIRRSCNADRLEGSQKPLYWTKFLPNLNTFTRNNPSSHLDTHSLVVPTSV